MNVGGFTKLLSLKLYLYTIKRKTNVIIGKGTRIGLSSSVRVKNGDSVRIGEKCLLRSEQKGYHASMPFPTTLLSDKAGAVIKVGDHCRINGAYIHAQKQITIGNNCVIASGVNIIDSNGHELYSSDRTQGRDEAKEIIIGENVWIGLNAIILKDTEIGDNSVVAAGSVVKGCFPKNSLIQGNPAILVKQLEIK
jgi:acetyltransferase-like isoleucine patch superfamily enzyme